MSKSAVCERLVIGTARKLAALMGRKLAGTETGGLKLIALMIDGAALR
jgi:hypothetical protein